MKVTKKKKKKNEKESQEFCHSWNERMKKWKLKNCTVKIMKSVLICGDEYIYTCKG